jgi:enolase
MQDRSGAIAQVSAREILDSRGRPTVEARVRLAGGVEARAAAPCGASTGAAEAKALRDGGARFEGLGVRRAVEGVAREISPALTGRDVADQAGLDARLRALDGTADLSRLGANAVVAVSMALVRASAAAMGQPLWRRIADLAQAGEPRLPVPMVNILSGGAHARGATDIQDVLIIPIGAGDWAQALDHAWRVRAAAEALCAERGLPTLLADEGGLAPGLAPEPAFALVVEAIERAGLRPGEDVALALDLAASGLLQGDGRYVFAAESLTLAPADLIARLEGWIRRWPIVSIEDPLGEEDWPAWSGLASRVAPVQLIGDDLFVTRASRIRRGVETGAADAALIKIDQNGVFTGACEALLAARSAGLAAIASARSGETADAFLADFAVGTGAGQVKIGSLRNAERLTKYDRLGEIAGAALRYDGWRGRKDG